MARHNDVLEEDAFFEQLEEMQRAADMDNAIRRLKFWCNAAPGFDRQRKHMRFPALFADAPPDALLEATQVTEAPDHILNDEELDELDGRSPAGGESAENDTSSSSSSTSSSD